MANPCPQPGCLQPVILPVFVPETKMKLRAFDGEKFSALSHVLSQTPTRRHTAGFGGKMAKTDDQPRINWISVTANTCERVGIIKPLAFGLIRSRPLGRAMSSTAACASSWHPGVSSQCWTAAVVRALLCVSCIMPTAPRHHVRSAQGPENLRDES